MFVDGSGNVGIGTATPTAKLQVVGSAEHTDNAALAASLTAGAFYRTGDLLKVVFNPKILILVSGTFLNI